MILGYKCHFGGPKTLDRWDVILQLLSEFRPMKYKGLLLMAYRGEIIGGDEDV